MRLPWVPTLLRTRTIHHVVPYSFIVHEISTIGRNTRIDTEVQEIVEKAYKVCKQTLSANWGLVKKLVALLLVEETVNAETLLKL